MGVIRSKTIRTRLFQILIVALGIVVAILAAVWRFSAVPALQVGVARSQQEIARRAADQIEQFVTDRVQGLVAASQIGRLWEMNKEAQKEAVYRLLNLDPHIQEIGLVDPTGREILRHSRSRVYTDADLGSLAQDENFQKAIKGGTYIGQVYYGRTAEPFITLAVPVKFTAREIKGVIIAEVTLKTLWNAISYIKVGKSGQAFVIDTNGNLIAHPEYSKVLLLTNLSHLQEVKKFLSHPSQDPDFGEEVIGESGQKAISTFAIVKGLNWAVLVEEPIGTALAEMKTVERVGILMLLVVTGAAFLISYFFSERIARPMRELEQRARLIAQGDLAQKLDIHTGDEIESLADQFNRMAEALKESYRGLEEKIAERTQDLSALYTALAPFASSDADRVLQKVVERLKEATHADAALIRIFDKETKSFLYPAHVGFPSSYLEGTRDLEQGSAIGAAFMTGEPIIAADIAEDPRLKRKRQVEAGFRSCAYLPLRVSGELRGIVHLASRQIGHFTMEKTAHLMAMARQMAIAMEHRELFQDAERRAKEQEALNVIATATSQSLRLDETLQIALDKVLEITGRERASIRLKDAVTGHVTLAAHRGFSQEEIETLLRRSQHRASEQVFVSGQPLVINDPEELHGAQPLLQQSRFVAWIPIKAGTNVVGVLGVSAGRPIPFEPREVELLQAIGNVVGVALENARLFQETEQKARHLSALHTVASTVSASLDLDQLVAKALDIILEVTGMDAGDIRLLEGDPPRLGIKVHKGVSLELVEKLRRGTQAGGKAEQVLTTQRSLVFESTQTSGLEMPPQVLSEGFTTAVWVPIISRDKAFGIIAVAARGHRTFNRNQLPLLEAIGASLGVALDNARLFQESQKNLERIRALREIDRAINSTLDLRATLDVLLEKIDLVLPYAVATIRLFNKESGLLEPLASRNIDEQEWRAEPWRGGRGIQRLAFESKAPQTIRNVQTDPRMQDLEFFRKCGLVSCLGVPLMVKDEALGVLSFYTKEEHEFSNDEVEFLSMLAGQAAIAIHNSQLYEQTREQTVELEKANKVKDQFLSVISHELRTPVNVIMGYTAMVKAGSLGEINSEQERALGKVANCTGELLGMINGILQVTTIVAQKVKVENHEFNLGHFLDDLRSGCELPLDKELTLRWEYSSDPAVITADSRKLNHILQNLINNAVKFTDRGLVTVSAKILAGSGRETTAGDEEARVGHQQPGNGAREGSIELKVADTGVGIESEKLPIIFELFRQGDSSETRLHGGVGLGLYIAKTFTELLGGKIEVESEEGKGSTFTVTIPCTICPSAMNITLDKGQQVLDGRDFDLASPSGPDPRSART